MTRRIGPGLPGRELAAVGGLDLLSFDHHSRSGTTRTRRIEPYTIVTAHGRWYLLAYDIDRADWRTFRIDRIPAATPLRRHFLPRKLPGSDPITARLHTSTPGRLHTSTIRLHGHPRSRLTRILPAAGQVPTTGRDRVLNFPCWKVASTVSTMESMEQPAAYTPEEARQALDAVSETRARLVERAAIPWWYHLGMALSFGLAISSFSMGEGYPSLLVPGGMLVVPFALSWLVGKKTGVGLDLYRTTPSAVAPGWKWAGAFVPAVVVGAVLQWGFDLPWAMAAAGAVVFGLTSIYSPRVTAAMLEDLRAGRNSIDGRR